MSESLLKDRSIYRSFYCYDDGAFYDSYAFCEIYAFWSIMQDLMVVLVQHPQMPFPMQLLSWLLQQRQLSITQEFCLARPPNLEHACLSQFPIGLHSGDRVSQS